MYPFIPRILTEDHSAPGGVPGGGAPRVGRGAEFGKVQEQLSPCP